jgi:myosin heavy subunit
MEINFDKKYNIKGGNVTAYLLEKSRVVKQGPQERNYHVFYMLLAGASKEMRKELNLKPAEEFQYLIQSNCVSIKNRDEVKEYEELVAAMHHLNIEETIQNTIFQIVAAVLHLGNVTFVASKGGDFAGAGSGGGDGATEGSKISSPSTDTKKISSLLGIDSERLEIVLCNKDTNINGETLLIPLTPEKAQDQRDSLAKFLYQKVFDYIVYIVNISLYRGKVTPTPTTGGGNIGVLDIFGFEVFQNNSFEQLCINYCNERLQTFFNEIIFDNEMKLYVNEDLPIDDISYQVIFQHFNLHVVLLANIFLYNRIM